MANFTPWVYASENTVSVDGGTPHNPKKLTGTRLAKALGLNHWGTPFQAWCEVMRVAEPPFEGNKYTNAGNVLEPLLIDFCKTEVHPGIQTPEEFFGVRDAKRHTGYDFFKHPIFGGMWDAVVPKLAYIEAKTSSRPQDWKDGVPDNYAIQALEYAYLDGLPEAYVVVRFMEPHEYDTPADCICTDDNTFVYQLDVDTYEIAGQTISELMEVAEEWWQRHVVGNVSPEFDEKADKEYLAIMRCNEVVKHDGLESIAKEAAVLEAKIEEVYETSGLKAMEKRLKDLKDKHLKVEMQSLMGENDNTVTAYGWRLKKGVTETIDKAAMKDDGVFDKYVTTKDRFTLAKEAK